MCVDRIKGWCGRGLGIRVEWGVEGKGEDEVARGGRVGGAKQQNGQWERQ